ncbi:hypothetical protein FRX31_025495 [Thalictrum thalictroides]|uniref:Transmembrane protein n=1 Tax=Thalictrum thalictroides TaxID=46969 RepID=A0A7J6VJZ0_THATH|nr:hypothetical protein FRX31_025495 [Thalictrum thalictroides]
MSIRISGRTSLGVCMTGGRSSSSIWVSFGDHEEEEKVYGDEIVPFKGRIVKPDDHQHGQSYLPLFIFSLILILNLKFYFD